MEEKMVEKRLFISQKAEDALCLYSIYNEQLKTLFIRLEGSIDRKGAKELAKGLKDTICEKIDQVILDFTGTPI